MLFREIIAVYYKNHEKDKDTLWAKHIYFNVTVDDVCIVTIVQSVSINPHLHISHDTALLYLIGHFHQMKQRTYILRTSWPPVSHFPSQYGGVGGVLTAKWAPHPKPAATSCPYLTHTLTY
jgi:hypothetical protein